MNKQRHVVGVQSHHSLTPHQTLAKTTAWRTKVGNSLFRKNLSKHASMGVCVSKFRKISSFEGIMPHSAPMWVKFGMDEWSPSRQISPTFVQRVAPGRERPPNRPLSDLITGIYPKINPAAAGNKQRRKAGIYVDLLYGAITYKHIERDISETLTSATRAL